MESFKTKKAITDLLNQFLKDNEADVIKDEKIIDVLHSLIECTQTEKLANYKSFSIGLDGYRHKAYFIDTTDGQQLSFSYRWLIREYEPLCKRKRLPTFIIGLQQVCRNEINDQIKEYVINGNQCVDHYPIPFVQLVANWYELRGVREYKFRKDKFNKPYFYESECSEHWKAYHRLHAKLRVIDSNENSKNGSYGVKVNWYNLINKNT